MNYSQVRESGFPEYLTSMRRKKGLSMNEVSALSGVSGSQLSRITNGTRGTPKPETIKKLCMALDVPFEEMMSAAGYSINPYENYWKERALKAEKELAKLKESINKLISG